MRPDDDAHSGFDRGHLCPSADRMSTVHANETTFVMSNMHPQRPDLNRYTWKALEVHERDLVKRHRKELLIVAGGIFTDEPSTIGDGIAVPSAEWKVIVVLGEGDGLDDVNEETPVIAVVMPNDASVKTRPWTAYITSVDEVEEKSGYDFLARLPDDIERVVEARIPSAP